MSDESPTPDSENAISLSFRCEDVQQFGTRSEAPKEPEETNIKDLYVFFFNNSGGPLPLSTTGQSSSLFATTNGDVPYIHLTGGVNSVVLLPGYFGTGANKAQIYAVANLEGFSPDQIENLSSLTGYKYQPASEVSRELNKLPVSGMPMFGSLSASLSQNASRTLSLKALMAKVEFVFGINSSNTDATGTYPQMSVQKLTFGNRPNGVILGGGSSTTQFGTANNAVSKQDKNEFTKTFVLQHAGQTHTEIFYVYENIQPARNLSETPELSFLNQDFEGKERYRAARANANASYVEIEGVYHDATKTEYKAKLIFHLGGNNYDNFEVKRNCHYKNSIFINGLQSNSIYDVKSVLYDSRVTVTTSGPYFVSMLKGQDVDAHFGVSPIDFYFYDDEDVTEDHRLKVEILDPTNNSWIRLEKVDAQYMQNSTLPSGWTSTHIDAGSGSWMAGHGKRKYFTTDLVTNTLNGNTQCYVTNHRDRVYLYIDENISKSNRAAQIKLTYEMQTKDNAQWHASPKAKEVTIDITQRGLLEFYAKHPKKNEGGYFYLEQIEEYLDNFDPYDSYDSDQVYTGLPWGLNGTPLASLSKTWTEVYVNGDEATLKIMEKLQANNDYNLNSVPRAAAEYCYNKNKRNSSGQVADFTDSNSSGWFLPGITQLESFIVTYKTEFPSFNTEFYWSSAAGKTYILLYEDSGYARATRFDYLDEVDGDFIPSDHDDDWEGYDGTGGKAPRNQSIRIRAVYQKGNGQRLLE